MSHYGDVAQAGTLDCHFTTRRFTTGVPFALAGGPVVSAYPDNGLTQLTAGMTLTVNLDGVVGLNHLRVVASGANGYVEGSRYTLVLTAGTVDGVSVVGEVVGSFRVFTPPLPLDAAGVRAAVGLASANLDTQLSALASYVDTEVASILAAVDTEVAAIKVKTDQLTFTVASRVDASTPAAGSDPTIAAIKAQTDQLSFTLPGKVDAALQAAADLGTAVGQKVADMVLRRIAANSEASTNGDPLSHNSLYGIVQRASRSDTTTNPGKHTIFRTNGTELAQVDIVVAPDAEGITGFGG